ncbi:hypothetical protein F2Q68_00034972 [Brassica cretica]|uniref:Serine-threonine/tyrosine-protein kinase catalytic domain-containing protein n=1 Tax=Brassica cretica TaxID=69181 RepID=A0A8S9GXK2_BRACR|nr:hypothetical protein F2Q68_00034972 [Brassica cretica]
MYEEASICLPEHEEKFTRLLPSLRSYSKADVDDMVHGIYRAQEMSLDDTYKRLDDVLSMLAVEETAHPQSHVMEEIPSKEIILETPQASGNEQSIGHYSPIANNLQQFHMERDFPPLTHGRDDGLGEGVLSLSICCSLFQTYGDLSFNNLTGDVHGGRAPEYTSLTGNRLSGEVESGVFLKSNAHIDLSYNYFSWWPSCQENSNINAYQSSYLNNLNELLPCAGPTNYTSCFANICCSIVCVLRALTLHQRGDIMEIVDPVLQGDFNSKEAVRMIKVAFVCTNSSPSLRPTMSEAVKMLEGEINIRGVMSDPGLYGHNWSISNLINIDTHGSSSVSGVAHQTATTMQSSVSGSDLYPFCNESMILNSTEEFDASVFPAFLDMKQELDLKKEGVFDVMEAEKMMKALSCSIKY